MKTRLYFSSYIAILLTASLALAPLVDAQDNLNKPVQNSVTRPTLKPCKIPGIEEELLCGVSPTYHKSPLHHSRDGRRALNLLLDECAADSDCNKAFPNIKKELMELLARLGRRPAQARYALPETGKEVAVTIRSDVFAEKLRSALYTPPGARKLPFK